jgi:CBS domain containing-hemolysin-like protein
MPEWLAPYLYLLAAFGLVLMNAFFVASEFAIVKIRTSRLETLVASGATGAKSAQHAVQHLDAYLSATQFGITLASLGLGWVGEPAFARLIEPVLGVFGIGSPRVVHSVSVGFAFAVISFLHLVLGELAPKSLAIQKPESTTLAIALPMRFFYYLFYPVLRVLNAAANGVLRLVGVTPVSAESLVHSEEELRIILAESAAVGAVSGLKRRLLDNVFTYTRRTAQEIMIPRNEIAFLSLARTWDENLATIRSQQHTRYPLCTVDLDQVVGMVHMKDVFHAGDAIRKADDLLKWKRDILYVPESITLDQLQRQFQQKRVHMAVVVDEYGGTAGLVTLEDVIEELIGEIQDEFDREESKIQRTGDGHLVDGLLLIEDLNGQLGLELEGGEARTVGGFVASELGRIPRTGDRLTAGGRVLEVVEMKGRRVARILVRPEPPASSAGESTPA